MHQRLFICMTVLVLVLATYAQKAPPPPKGKPAPKMIQPRKKPKTVPPAPKQSAPPVAKKTKPAPAAPAAKQAAAGGMSIKRASIALDVVDRVPQDTGTVFPPEVKRLYCFSEVINGLLCITRGLPKLRAVVFSLGYPKNSHTMCLAKYLPMKFIINGFHASTPLNSANDFRVQ